ncbi:hypothetical protein JCM17380_42150 [Desulfosporosinus burensis]
MAKPEQKLSALYRELNFLQTALLPILFAYLYYWISIVSCMCHLLNKFTMPVITARELAIYIFPNYFKNVLYSIIEGM